MIIILMGVSERDTLQSWTVIITIVVFTGLEVAMITGVFV